MLYYSSITDCDRMRVPYLTSNKWEKMPNGYWAERHWFSVIRSKTFFVYSPCPLVTAMSATNNIVRYRFNEKG